MNVAIFIRSYWRDAPWLEYALRSIGKYTRGFAYVMVVVPSRDHAFFAPLQAKYGFRLYEYGVVKGKEMLHSEVMLCRADEICPDADHILLTDSDCVFWEPVTPADYMVKGKPVILGKSFATLAKEVDSPSSQAIVRQWLPAARNALGFEPTHETMTRHPAIFHRGLFTPFRAAVEKHTGRAFDDYVLSCRNEYPQTFAELTSLGNFALHDFQDQYFFADLDGPEAKATSDSGSPVTASKVKQFWSHGGITPALRTELEAICA